MPNFKKNTSPAMKRSSFKMKGYSYPGTSPLTLTDEEKLDNLRKHKEKYEGMTEEEQARFNEAWKNAGGKTKQVKKPNS